MLLVLLSIAFQALSLLVLGGGAWLLWDWYDADTVVLADGTAATLRDDWKLWTAIALLAWSFLGRFILASLLARADRERPGRKGESEKLQLDRAAASTLAVAEASLFVEDTGAREKPPLIFVHGWGLNAAIWDYARRDLGNDFRLVRFDLRGLGKSRTDVGAVGLSEFASDLRDVIRDVGGHPVLVGHSIGGMTVQTLARDDRQFVAENVRGVVLLNTTYTDPNQTAAVSGLLKALRWPLVEPVLWLARWLGPLAWLSAWQGYLSGSAHLANRFGFGRDVSRSQLEATTLMQVRNSPSVQAKGNLAMMRWDATDALGRFPVPALVIGGGADIVTRPGASRHIAGRMPDARLEIVDGVGHMGFLERADLYNDAIARFASEVRRKAAAGDTSSATQDGAVSEVAMRASQRLEQAQRPAPKGP